MKTPTMTPRQRRLRERLARSAQGGLSGAWALRVRLYAPTAQR